MTGAIWSPILMDGVRDERTYDAFDSPVSVVSFHVAVIADRLRVCRARYVFEAVIVPKRPVLYRRNFHGAGRGRWKTTTPRGLRMILGLHD